MALWDSTKEALVSEISEGFLITQGNPVKTAELLGIHHSTVYDYVHKYPELEKKMLECRRGLNIQYIDVAEQVVRNVMQMTRDKPGYAFQAAKYYLECQAKDRGWGPQSQDANSVPNDEDIDYKILSMRQEHKIKILEEKLANQSKTESEPSGSDTQI